MKAISIKQPWAGLIRMGAKTIETRTWRTHYRGPFLICTSQKHDDQGAHFVGTHWPDLALEAHEQGHTTMHGMAIARARLVNCRLMTQIDEVDALCGFRPGLYAWELRFVEPIDPFPVKGKQGWFDYRGES